MSARASAFHVRTAEHNLGNAWLTRGAFTLAARYGDARQEALAARAACAMIDASFMTRLRVHGAGAAKLLAAACSFDADALGAGSSRRVFWCANGGGVRGIGMAARFGATNFVLRSFESDGAWFDAAAKRFDASVRDETMEKGLLFLLGPRAADVLAAVDLHEAALLEPGKHAVFSWRGVSVTVSRWSSLSHALDGYELACANDDAVMVFDRLWRAGQNLGLVLAGQEAFDTLLLEQGVPIPGMDFAPAREAKAREPLPAALGLSDSSQGTPRVLAGLEFDSEVPMAFAPVLRNGAIIGATMRSAYSPVLRRAIALAQLDRAQAVAGTAVTVRRLTQTGNEDVSARVTALPIVAPAMNTPLKRA
jgi:glycine cleavage system aminomethyltransferase T